MIKELLYKWFGLDNSCLTCQVLQERLDSSERERKQLLDKVLELSSPKKEVEPEIKKEDLVPIMPQVVPWRVRQHMLEQEDRAKALLLRDKQKEIADLEKETGVKQEVS